MWVWFLVVVSLSQNEEASMSGMLGGLTQVHDIDAKTSLSFVQSLKSNRNLVLGMICVQWACLAAMSGVDLTRFSLVRRVVHNVVQIVVRVSGV